MNFCPRLIQAILLGSLSLSAIAYQAQQPMLLTADATMHPESNAPGTADASETTATRSSTSVAQPANPVAAKFDRWVDMNTMNFSFRYRSETASDDFRYFNNGQQRSIVDGRLKLDAEARYTVNFHLSTGKTFNWAYSDEINPDFQDHQGLASEEALSPQILNKLIAAIGQGFPIHPTPSRGWEMYFRQLYIGAAPVKWLTLEYGGLGIERGQSSEITSYDDDGYITGERLRLHDPAHLYLDEMSVTYGYEGDIFRPNFFDRTQTLKHSNYHQFLVAKNFTKRVKASADYTFDKKGHTIREAALLEIPESKVLDSLRTEFYQRPNTVNVGIFPLSGGSGFALTGAKTLFRRFKLDGGYEQVDWHYGANVDDPLLALFGFSMNGDSYSTGNHVFTHGSLKLTPYASLTGFYIHQTAPPPTTEFGFAKEGFNGSILIDLKEIVSHPRQIF